MSRGDGVRRFAARALAATFIASIAVVPRTGTADAAADPAAQGASVRAEIPVVTKDDAFRPLPRGSSSPWDGEVVLDGIDGLSYNSPGTEVKVRAMSSNAFFVDEVWLVYPKVMYLFNNKDVQDFGGGFQEIAFSHWIGIGTFPQGTELIFGVKTGVGIDDQCRDRVNADGSVDRHHCYKVTQDPSFVPLAPDPQRVCALDDAACRNKAWPSTAPDGRSIFYTGPGVRNVKDDSPHGRFQFLTHDGTQPLTNVALFGLEDVGAPKSGCPGASELRGLVTRDAVAVSGAPQTVRVSSVAGLSAGGRATIYQPFQRETVTLLAVNALESTITAVFGTPDGKPYAAGTNYAPDGCDWHPDFQDAGVVVWPALAATCSPTAVAGTVTIVGQPGYGTVRLRDSLTNTVLGRTFAPGDTIAFVAVQGLTVPTVTETAPGTYAVRLGGTAYMIISDPDAPDTILNEQRIEIPNPNKTIDAGICFDPAWPPVVTRPASVTAYACAAPSAVWDFTITRLSDPAKAPPSIRVTWSNDQSPRANEAATVVLSGTDLDPLTSTWTAHYRTDQFTTLRVASATATLDVSGWLGTFSLASGPCPEQVQATLLLPCAAGLDAWDVVITGTTQLQAPPKVTVTWADGSVLDVFLAGPVEEGTAHYRTALHLDQRMITATALIQGTWTGTFSVNGVACVGTLSSPSPSASPSAAPSPSPTIPPGPTPTPTVRVRTPTLTDHECVSTEWHFVITQIQSANAPRAITVAWANGASAEIPLEKVTGGTAHYRTTLNLDVRVIDATAVLVGSYGQFNVSHGPCISGFLPAVSTLPPLAGPTATPAPSTSPSPAGPTPSAAPRPSGFVPPVSTLPPLGRSTPTPSPSAPATRTVSVAAPTLSDHGCDVNEWHFLINRTTAGAAPAAVTVTWSNGITSTVGRASVTGSTAHYRTSLHLDARVTAASAVVPATWSGSFNLSSGPCR